MLDLEHTRVGFFNEEHERVLTTLAAQVAIAIENARLYQAVRRQEAQLERDIAMAREVQLRLLPAAAPEMANAEMAVRFLPARTIGGDLYDFVEYGPGRTAIVLGDVSGKAAPAALFAALVSGIMRSAAQQRPEPARMLATAERRTAGAQAGIAVRDHALCPVERRQPHLAGGQLGRRAANLLPLRRGGTRCAPRAFRWGCFPTSSYDELNVATEPGDVIVFVSDGILDAENAQGEMYGQERLAELLCSRASEPAQEIADAILDDVSRFQGEQERFDDETIIVLRVR